MKTYRRILSFICALLFLIPLALPAYAADTAVNFTVRTDKDTYQPGETIYITFEQNVGLTQVLGYELLVYYNPDLVEWDEAKTVNSTGLSNAAYAKETPTEGTRIKLADVDMNATLAIGAGTVNTVAFTAKEEGEPAFTFSATVYDSNFDAYTTTCTTGKTVTVSASEVSKAPDGYSVYASADVTTTTGGAATIQLFATHSDKDKEENAVETYNAYDITLTYDKDKLTLSETFGGAAAGENAKFTHDAQNGTLRIAGYGADKEFTEAIAELTFTMNGNGAAEVTIGETKMAASQAAIQDAPAAAKAGGSDATHDKAVIKVPYTVTLPDGFEGAETVLPGADYTFTAPGNWFEKVLVSIGGAEAVEIEPDVEGGLTYTITGVNGNVVITAVGKTYNVTANAGTGATVDIGDKNTAQYGVDYTFTAGVASGAMKLDITIADATYTGYSVSGSTVTIPGKDIKGDISIQVTAEVGSTNITFDAPDGVVVGGNNQVATNGVDFKFSLNTVDTNDYIVKLGDTLLKPDNEGYYTIPGEMIDGTALTVTVTVTAREFVMEVAEYITLNNKAMYLVMAKEGSKVLAYNGEPMYWSEKYQFESEIEALGEEAPAGAYCWLVITDETVKTVDDVKTAARAAIAEATAGTTAETVAYDCDVNQTGVVDINDAQLTYNMYQAKMYENFTAVTMDEFLEADLNNDKEVDSLDAVAVVNNLLGLEAENENAESNASEQN